jgi:hypothetical protein
VHPQLYRLGRRSNFAGTGRGRSFLVGVERTRWKSTQKINVETASPSAGSAGCGAFCIRILERVQHLTPAFKESMKGAKYSSSFKAGAWEDEIGECVVYIYLVSEMIRFDQSPR